jgi:hypothetical protein
VGAVESYTMLSVCYKLHQLAPFRKEEKKKLSTFRCNEDGRRFECREPRGGVTLSEKEMRAKS